MNGSLRYVKAVLAMAVIAVAGIVLVLLVYHGDPLPVVLILLGSLSPTTIALLALLKAADTHRLINSRMDELLKSEKAISRAEGVIEGHDARRA